MRCPKCGHIQSGGAECQRCGVVFARTSSERTARRKRAGPAADLQESDPALHHLLTSSNRLMIEQDTGGVAEVWLGIEQANEYAITNGNGALVGHVVEQGRGFVAAVARMLLGSFRPFQLVVFAGPQTVSLELSRPFAIYFSRMEVTTLAGVMLGAVERRFALLKRRYSLFDESGRVFATISSPIFRIWTFPVLDPAGRQRAVISKKWSGLAREWATDADTFGVDFTDHPWSPAQRAVIFAAALSIDLDFFESNSSG